MNERIKLAYGHEYGLTIKSVVGEYTEVYLEIPLDANRTSEFTASTLDEDEGETC